MFVKSNHARSWSGYLCRYCTIYYEYFERQHQIHGCRSDCCGFGNCSVHQNYNTIIERIKSISLCYLYRQRSEQGKPAAKECLTRREMVNWQLTFSLGQGQETY
ncbi:unnamed protein product [Musa textilis]